MQDTHKTKILCTIGPATDSLEMIEKLLLAGMNVARLNFSHGEFPSHQKTIRLLRQASDKTGLPLAIMADLPGPKIRIGKLESESVELQNGNEITLTTQKVLGNEKKVSVNFENMSSIVKPGDKLFLNDGLISLKVISVNETNINCVIRAGGELRSRKGVDLPGIDLGISAFTERDRECLNFALMQGVDAVSQSFVSNANDIKAVRQAAHGLGYSPFVIAKIERKQALENIDEILEVSDGIMVARGDLGVEIPIAHMAVVQKCIIKNANAQCVPVITATQMLESMTEHRHPTRAEATDVANAIFDGSDAVMLSAESAIGRYPVEAVKMLADIAVNTEQHLEKAKTTISRKDNSIVNLISRSVQDAVNSIQPVAVIVPTKTGATARNVSNRRLNKSIIAFTTELSTARALNFSYGVIPVVVETDLPDWTPFVLEWLKNKNITAGVAVLTQGPSAENPTANHRLEIIHLDK